MGDHCSTALRSLILSTTSFQKVPEGSRKYGGEPEGHRKFAKVVEGCGRLWKAVASLYGQLHLSYSGGPGSGALVQLVALHLQPSHSNDYNRRGIQASVSSFRVGQVSGFRFQVSGFRFQVCEQSLALR